MIHAGRPARTSRPRPRRRATMRARITARWRPVTIPCRTAHGAQLGLW